MGLYEKRLHIQFTQVLKRFWLRLTACFLFSYEYLISIDVNNEHENKQIRFTSSCYLHVRDRHVARFNYLPPIQRFQPSAWCDTHWSCRDKSKKALYCVHRYQVYNMIIQLEITLAVAVWYLLYYQSVWMPLVQFIWRCFWVMLHLILISFLPNL